MTKLTVSFVHQVMNEFHNEEITFSRMVEKLNEETGNYDGFIMEEQIKKLKQEKEALHNEIYEYESLHGWLIEQQTKNLDKFKVAIKLNKPIP